VKVIVQNFGEVAWAKQRLWSIPAGPLDTQTVGAAVIRYFRDSKLHSDFDAKFSVGRRMLNKSLTEILIIKIDKTPPWEKKQIHVNGADRQVTGISPKRCSFCLVEGHDLWDYKNEDHLHKVAKIEEFQTRPKKLKEPKEPDPKNSKGK
jgi:hypothetical protein